MLKVLNKILMGIANFLSACSTVVLTAMMVLVVVDVLLRTFINKPITGSTELTQMLMAGLILGFAKSCLGNDNLKVDVVAERLPVKVQYVLNILTSILCIGVSVLLTWRTVINALYHAEKNLVYMTLSSVAKWPFIALLAFGFASGIVGLLLRIMKITAEHKANSASPAEEESEGGVQ